MNSFLSRLGLRNIRAGSPLLSIFETAAQSDLRSSQDTFNALNSISLDRSEGAALLNAGADEDIFLITASPSFGYVTITDSSFEKINSKIFQGAAAPIVGSTSIKIDDATDFPATGEVYLGRNTGNYEGPLAYSAKTDNGNYWTLTLSGPTLRYHNTGETAILAQGGSRIVGSGQIVKSSQGFTTQPVEFSVVYSVTIPDGEVSSSNIFVVAKTSGGSTNVIAGAVSNFGGAAPFTDATVTNPLPFTNGQDTESQADFKDRIRKAKQTRVKGTSLAVQTAAIDVISSDENKRVISSSIIKNPDGSSTLYIDDGTGYEELTEGVAIESIVDSALGGELYFALSSAPPISKAFATTTLGAPFALLTGSKLAVKVGGVTNEHTFDAAQFRAIGNASAYEVVASINSNPNVDFSARTTDSGARVSVFAKAYTNEDIEITTTSENNANTYLGFPTGKIETLKLYKNDRLLSKDGELAIVYGDLFNTWGIFSGSQTLTVAIDGTPTTTYTFTSQSFIDAETDFVTVANNSLAAWRDVINITIPGITAAIDNNSIVLTSNLGRSARAAIEITGGSLVTNGLFTVADSSATGKDRDYSLDVNTGQITLEEALVAGDKLAAGTLSTRAFLESNVIAPVTLADDATLWLSVDGDPELIDTGANSTSLLNVIVNSIKPSGYRVRISSSASESIFSNVVPGDWVVFPDAPFNDSLKGAWKVAEADDTYIEINKKSMSAGRTGHTMTLLADGTVLVTGGYIEFGIETFPTNSCEIYDPTTKLWTSIAAMGTSRAEHTATLLTNNKVLVVGGRTLVSGALTVIATCELYDPTAGTWTAATSVTGARYAHTATRLATGNVLVAGGIDGTPTYLATTYSYSVAGNSWASTGVCVARARHTAELIDGTDVLLVGGEDASVTLASCDRYSGAWAIVGSFTTARQGHQTVLLSNADVLLIGGSSARHGVAVSNQSGCERYNTVTNLWGAGPTGLTARSYHTAARIVSGTGANDVVVAFGYGASASPYYQSSVAGTGNWSSPSTVGAPKTPTVRVKARSVSVANTVLVAGGQSSTLFYNYAGAELFTRETLLWSQPDPAIANGIAGALKIVRSSDYLKEIVVPAGSSYTATSFVSALNDQLSGAESSVYKTSQIRMNTKTFSNSGGIALVAQDELGEDLQLSTDILSNLSGHVGSVESGNEGVGTPDFGVYYVKGSITNYRPILDIFEQTDIADHSYGTEIIDLGMQLVGLNNNNDDVETTPAVYPLGKLRDNNNRGFVSSLTAIDGTNFIATTRDDVYSFWSPYDRAYLANPYRIGPNDDLTVLVDGDEETKRFNLNLYRKVTPTNTTYASQNTLVDVDNDEESLSLGFGLDFDFNDFAVFMKARVQSHPATANKTTLWRYFRHGPEGNGAKVRYVKPSEENAGVGVTHDRETRVVSVSLASGALRTITATGNNKIGAACTSVATGIGEMVFAVGLAISSASRDGANVNTLTLTLPGAVTDHGLIVGDIVYINSSDILYSSGTKIITARTATTVSYAEVAAAAGPTANIGTLSVGPAEALFTGGGAVVNDFFRLTTGVSLGGQFLDRTLRINSIQAQSLRGQFDSYSPAAIATLQWGAINDTEYVKIFVNSTQTTELIVAAVNVIANSPDSTVPMTATLIGSGAGTMNDSSAAEAADTAFAYTLADGMNYVKTTVLPATINDDYEFVFKHSISSGLAVVGNDWVNEDIRLVPTTTKNIVDFLSAQTTSGLSSVAEIKASSQGKRVQIASLTAGTSGSVQVQGGTANSTTATVQGDNSTNGYATVDKDSAIGFVGNSWAAIDNTNRTPKAVTDINTALIYLTADGYLSFDETADPIWTPRNSAGKNAIFSVEKQGKFVCYTNYENRKRRTVAVGGMSRAGAVVTVTSTGHGIVDGTYVRIVPGEANFASVTVNANVTGANTFTYGSAGAATTSAHVQYIAPEILHLVAEGDWVYISSSVVPSSDTSVEYKQISSTNTGIFRVVRVARSDESSGAGTFWIENPNAENESASECDVVFLSGDTVMPGDTLEISTNLWGEGNKGSWVVESVGVAKATTLAGSLSKVGTAVTASTVLPHGFSVGDLVTVSPGEGNFPGGIITIATTPTDIQFTYTVVAAVDLVSSFAQTFTSFPFENGFRIKLSTDIKSPTVISAPPGALGASYPLVQVIEAEPARYIKQIIGIVQNPLDGGFLDITFANSIGSISESAGSVITALDKLDFDLDTNIGSNGYSHTVGLIGEVNKVIYGSQQDLVAYPGIAVAGATVNTSGPLVKRIQVSVQVRTKGGSSRKVIEASVRSVVATTINQTKIGQPISLGAIVAAIEGIGGVVSCAIISPTYNASNDIISLQPFEKSLVLDLNTDILVSFVG